MNCGIYKITNIVNGKCYVGASVNIHKRWKKHISDFQHGKHANRLWQKSFDELGREKFEFKVLLYCEEFEMDRYEQYFFDLLEPEYNCITNIKKKKSGDKRSPEACARMSELHKGNKNCLGRKHTDEERRKMSESAKGNHFRANGKRKTCITPPNTPTTSTPPPGNRSENKNSSRQGINVLGATEQMVFTFTI